MSQQSKKISRREFLKRSGKVAAATVITSNINLLSCKKRDHSVRIGYLPITDAAPLLTAYDRGYFRDQGLTVEKPVMVQGWSSLVEAYLSDKVNVVHFLLPIPIWMRYKNSTPLKVIAWDHTNGSALTISPDSAITSFADLGGTQIAVPFWYSMHNVILQLGLRSRGLRPVIKPGSGTVGPDEVNLRILAPPEMPAALSAGKIDGYIVAEPFNALSEENFGAKILRFTGDIWKNHPCCVIVMMERIIRDDPVFVQKVTNGIVRAQAWMLKNRSDAAVRLSRQGSGLLPVDQKILQRVFTGYENERYGGSSGPRAIKHPEWNLDRIGFQPYPFPTANQFIYREMRKTVIEGNNNFLQQFNPDFVAGDLTDPQFAKQAIQELGGPSIFPELDFTSPWEREEVIEL